MYRNLFAASFLLSVTSLWAADVDQAASFTYSGSPIVEPAKAVISAPDAAAPLGARIRISDWNIETLSDGIGDEPARTPEVAEHHVKMAAAMLDKVDADVLLLQEIENSVMLKKLNDALAQPRAFGYVTQYGSGSLDEVKLNDAVLSRFPVLNPTEIDFGPLTGPGRPTRGLMRFTIDLGENHLLLVYVMHLKSNFGNKARNIAERKAGLKLLREDAAEVMRKGSNTTWEVLAAGDTNMDPDTTQFTGDDSFEPVHDWLDLFRQVPPENRVTMATRMGDPALVFPPACFDRIFVSPEMTNSPWTVSLPASLQEGCDTNNAHALPGIGAHVSDHYMVHIDLSK